MIGVGAGATTAGARLRASERECWVALSLVWCAGLLALFAPLATALYGRSS